MALAAIEKERIRDLAEGRVEPGSGMEKHFLEVVNGNASACTEKEKEWLNYWQNVCRGTESQKGDTGTDELEKIVLPDDLYSTSFEGEVPSQAKRNGITGKIKSEITDIESRTDISDEQKVSRITHIACATCAGVAVQPIPFADIFVLTPIQAYFGTRIAAIRGVPVRESEVIDVIKEIVGIIGMGVIAQQLAIGVWKIVTGGLGGFLTVPLVYGLSYAIMKVIDAYYLAKARKSKLTDKQMKKIWRQAFQEGKKKGESETSNKDA